MAVITKESLPVDEINDNISKLLTKTKSNTIKNLSKLASAQTVSADEDEEQYELNEKRVNLERMFATVGGQQTQGNYTQGYGEGLVEGTKSGYQQGVKDGKTEGQQEFLLKLLSKAALTIVGVTAMKTLLNIMGLDQYIPFLDSQFPDLQKPGQESGGGKDSNKSKTPPNIIDTGYRDYYNRPIKLDKAPAAAFKDMVVAGRKKGIDVAKLITSSYRDPQENTRVGGASNSPHLYGEAFDINFMNPNHKWVLDNAEQFGFKFNPYRGESTHFDWTGDYTPSNLQSMAEPEQTPAALLESPGTETLASAETPPSTMESLEEPSIAMQPDPMSMMFPTSMMSSISMMQPIEPLFLPPPVEETSQFIIEQQPRNLEYLNDTGDIAMNETIYIQPVIITT